VTIPHKQDVVPLIDETSEMAAKIGAVNTSVHTGGRLVGHNTDAGGFARSLKDDAGFDAKGKRTVLLGSGGAARAVPSRSSCGRERHLVARQPQIDAMVVALKPLTRTGTTSWAY
jgi:shikimate 5-dehydrogenase